MEEKKIRVGLLGGSFNPPHLGHADICKYVLDRDLCDRVWIIPCFTHPFGKPMAPFGARLTMCRFAFQDFGEKVWVSDVEKALGGVSHTVKTIEHLRAKNPNKIFSLIMGADVSREKEQWREFERIRDLVNIIEIPRGPNGPIMDISSTEIRRLIKGGESYGNYVVIPVAVYIVTHALYHE